MENSNAPGPRAASRRQFATSVITSFTSIPLFTSITGASQPEATAPEPIPESRDDLDELYDALVATYPGATGQVWRGKRGRDSFGWIDPDRLPEPPARFAIGPDGSHPDRPVDEMDAAYQELVEAVMIEAGVFIDDEGNAPDDDLWQGWGRAVAVVPSRRRLYVLMPLPVPDPCEVDDFNNYAVVAIDLDDLAGLGLGIGGGR